MYLTGAHRFKVLADRFNVPAGDERYSWFYYVPRLLYELVQRTRSRSAVLLPLDKVKHDSRVHWCVHFCPALASKRLMFSSSSSLRFFRSTAASAMGPPFEPVCSCVILSP